MTDQKLRKTPYEIFHVECGKGWECLYQPLIEVCKLMKVDILQIKEKFGGLRFYIGAAPEWVHQLTESAEICSFHICENCGAKHNELIECEKTAVLIRAGSRLRNYTWLRTLCDKCAAEYEKKNAITDGTE